jgi:ABC-2 type transport system ATP-binding protein
MAICTAGITKSFGTVDVLRGVDLHVARGTTFALLGPNGAGKTTLVHILSTLIRPDAGTAAVAGHDVVRAPKRVQAAISLTGQYAAVDELLTGEENLRMMARLRRLGRAAGRKRSADLLEQFDLVEARNRRVKTYSAGMRRRLDLAMSLLGSPEVIFLDEPTTGLDPRARQTTWQAVRELVASGVTIFLTTQYLEEADQLADRVALIDHGAIIAQGTPDELKWQLAGERVELCLAGPDQYEKALTLLDSEVADSDAQRHLVSVATDGTATALRRLLERMDSNGVEVHKVAVHRPSLDDVFVAMTSGGKR